MTELEVLLSDMTLAAACEAFVKDPSSTLSDMVESMRLGYGVMTPQEVLQEDTGKGLDSELPRSGQKAWSSGRAP